VYCPGTLLSGGIAYLTRRAKKGEIKVSHAFVVTGPNECIEANLPVGVVTSDLAREYLNRDDRVILFRKPKGLTAAAAQRIIKRARAQLGARFDVGGLAAEGMHGTYLGNLITTLFGTKPREVVARLLHQKGRWVCSELVAHCLRKEQRYRDKGVLARPAGTASPQELFEDDEAFETSSAAAGGRAPKPVKQRRTKVTH